MKHFKLFLLPLLAMIFIFSSCEKQDLSLTYIEPIQDWGKSRQDILEKMTKSKSGATLEYSNDNDEGFYLMNYADYGIANHLVYVFQYNKLIYSYELIFSLTNKQTILDYCEKKHTLVQINKGEWGEEYLYHNKKKTSSILAQINKEEKEIIIFYTPYIDGNIEDFYTAID